MAELTALMSGTPHVGRASGFVAIPRILFFPNRKDERLNQKSGKRFLIGIADSKLYSPTYFPKAKRWM